MLSSKLVACFPVNERRFNQLLYLIPILALAVCAVSLFWRVDEAEVRSASLMGGPTDSPAGFRGRLRAVREIGGMVLPSAGETIHLLAAQGSHESARVLTTGPDGWADFDVSRHPGAPLRLVVKDSAGKVLAEGTPELSTARWLGAAQSRGGPLRVYRQGEIEAQVIIPQGVVAVPFDSPVIVETRRSGDPLENAQVTVTGESAEVIGAKVCTTDRLGQCTFQVQPLHHVVSLVVTVSSGEEKLRFEQALPVVPGSLGLKILESGDLLVRSPVPRDEAWFTFVNRKERSLGGRIELKPTADGGASGIISKNKIPELSAAYVVLAGAADGRTTSSVGYPLDGQGDTFDVFDAYLLDGAPQLKALKEKKARRVSLALGAYLALSGLLTLALFVARVRIADKRLQLGLDRVGAKQGTRSSSAAPLVIAALSLFFAFSAAVVWIVAR